MNIKNKHFRTYLTDKSEHTKQENWLRIESTYKPSHADIKQATEKHGFTGSPFCVEFGFSKTVFVTTWAVKNNEEILK